MQLNSAHKSLTSGLGINELYLKRADWAANERRTRADIFNGRARPGDPASASKTMDDLAQLTRLDTAVDVPLVLLDNMYPPCATSIESLTKVNISDLKFHTILRGSVLIARRIGVPTQTWSRLLVGLQDETGNTCVLIFNHHMRDIPAEEFIPEGATLAIKQPYLHVDMVHSPHEISNNAKNLKSMFFALRVNHPADLVILPPCDILVPSQFRTPTSGGTAASWKESGNSAFTNGRYLEAHRCYTEGIRLLTEHPTSTTLMADLLRNRSRTGLSLRFYDDAKSDALQSSSLLTATDDHTVELNTKALFRAATATYKLDDYEGSKSILGQLREIAPNDNDAAALVKKIRFRLREQARGSYNFDQLRKSAEFSGNVDVASFLLRTEVRFNSVGVMGLYATQGVMAGDIIFCEKAFAATTVQDKQTQPAHLMAIKSGQLALAGMYDLALWKNVVEKATRNKSTSNRLNNLTEMEHVAYTAPSISAEDDVLLMFKRAQRNYLTITDSAKEPVSRKLGLFIHASQIDYSCMPNTARAFVGDLLVVRASRAIKAGERLFGTETHLFNEYHQTKDFINKTLNSHCECNICVAEEQTSPEQRVLRQEALKLVDAFCKTSRSFNDYTTKAQLNSAISKGVQLASKLSATYDDNTFQGVMPRRGLTKLYSALIKIDRLLISPNRHAKPKEVTKSLTFPMQALQAQGCKVAVDPSGNVSFANLYGVRNDLAQELLIDCALVAAAFARFETAKQFVGYAKEMHLLQHCDTMEFPQLFEQLVAISD